MKTLLLKLEKNSLLLLTLLLGINLGYGQTSQTFTTSGTNTFVIPAGVTSITVETWGAGGGGGNSNNTSSNGGSGGGGGSYAKGIHTVISGGTYYYTVGSKGTGGPASSTTAATAGGTSWFNATASTNAAPANSTVGTLSNGGGAGVNNSTVVPNNGGGAFGNTVATSGTTGNAGSNTSGGNGGAGANGGAGGAGSTTTNGSNGNPPGGGGGGSDDTSVSKGGDGADGQVKISWTCPTYALTSATTAAGPVCQGSTTVVTVKSTTLVSGTYNVTYTLSGGTTGGSTTTMTFSSVSQTGTFTTTALTVPGTVSAATTITITNISSSYCGNTVSTNNTASVTVNPTLLATVSTSATASTICAGTSVTFTATPTNGGTTPTYQWKINGTNVSGQTSSTFTSTTLANNDIVTVVMTSNASPCLTGSPATSSGITMTVNPNLPASVSIVASPSGAICSGTSVTFTATPTNGGATPTYQWKINGTNVSGQTASTFTSTTLANNDIVTVVMTSNASPCLTGSPVTSSGITMTVNPNLPASVFIAASATNICSGTSVTFTATPTNGGTTPTYQWKINGTNVVGQTATTYTTTTLAHANAVTCVMTSNASPCLTGSPVASNTINMTVNPNLPASVFIAASATNICAGSSVTFTATPTNGGTTPTYQWKINGVNVVGQTATTYTTTTLAQGNAVTCVMTSNASPCLTGSPVASNTINMTVNPVLAGSVAISASATTVCAGTNVTFTATPTNGGTASYQWKVNGTNVGTNSTTFSSTTLANGDAVMCVMTSVTACITGLPATSNVVTMIVNAVPTSIAGNVIDVCTLPSPLGVPINITSGAGATNYSSLLWTRTGGTGTLTNANSLTSCTYTPSALDIATLPVVTLTLTVNGNAGCSNVVSSKILTFRNPMLVNAGTIGTICGTTTSVSVTSGASATNATSTTWTSTNGTGTFTNPSSLTTCSYVPSATELANGGSINITLTASNGGCANVTSTKTLVISGIPTSNAGSTINTCSTTGAINITTGASASNYSSVTWSGGGGTFTNPNSLTTCTYTPSAAEKTAGSTITLTLTVVGNSPCGNATSTKTLNISKAMTAVAGTSFTSCATSTGAINITAGASTSNQTSLLWSSNGTGTLANANNIATCTYTPSATEIANGAVITLTLTASNAGCSNLTSTKTLTIYKLPTAVAGSAMTTCTSYGATNITGGSSATDQTSVTWTSTGTGTFANPNSLTTCTYTPSAADVSAGSVTLTLTAYGNAPCANATATKTLNITISPTVTGTTPGSRTGTGTVLLGATASLGTLNWYAAATGGSSLGTGTSFTTPTISTTTTFYVEAINGICPSAPRTPVVATVNYPEIDIQGNATSIVSGSTTPSITDWTDFGTTNSTRTFTIKNTGSALLTVGAITISGTNASEFTVTTTPASAVGIGAYTTFTVSFAPTAVGLRTATISIVDNDTDENPFTFAMQGTGVEQEIDIQGNSTSIVDGDSTPSTSDWTDFSNVAGTRTFTIRNTGNITLTIGAITIAGANASDFTVTTPPASTVPANGTTTFVVAFAPSAINARTATISIVNNDNTENPYDFAIQGFGIIPEIDIQGNATSIVDGDTTPSTTDWTDFSSTSGTRTFTIYNQGNIALTLGAITFTGTNASEFTVTTPPSSSVAAFSSTTFVITFLPTAVGTRSAVFHIVNNDGNENPYDFNIQGTGVPREIDVQGLGLSIASGDLVTSVNDGTDFGPADINLATVTRTFTIKNTGSLSLTISNPTITGTNASEFSITANPGTLSIGAGSSTTFQVTFNPNSVFTRVAQINIVNNDSDENPYIFAIQGTGLLDNDGDGIENNADLDDDNDGIIDTIECGTCVSDPFVNGSFETPAIGAATYSIEPSANVTGWNNSAENYIEIWSNGFSGVPSAAGNQFAELNANVAGNLYQSFCLNGAGGTINWSIKHRGRSGTDVAEVRFGATLASISTVATMTDGNTAWGSYSGTYNIPVGQTSIVLAFTAISSTGGLSYGNFIDDVQIIINQNCIDSDGDGVADLLDVDDDNDGIPDIEEAGFKAYSNNTGTMDKTSATTWKDTNANGLNDYIEALQSANTYTIPDTDGDGVPNHLDLDSDNDSIFDVDEAGLLNGDGDINGDGKGDGLDTEGDGLLNLYDNSTAFGSAFRAYAQDSDANGIPDFLQLDSNDDGVNDIQTTLYASNDANGDGKIDGSGDADKDGITDTFDTNNTIKGSPRDLNRKLFLDFDGRNDYAENVALLGGLSNATLMAWIDLNSAFSSTGVVVGQDKFQIKISSARMLQAVVNGTTLTYTTPIAPATTTVLNKSQWYHVAATYGGGTLTLYLNGKAVASQPISGSIAADASKLTLGRDPLSSTNYFKGKIDEVRVFNTTLTNTQVERMVYQEIQNTASQVRGAIVPKDVGSLPFANVLRYYRMDAYKDDIVDDLTTASIDTGTGMKLYNHKVINVQQAPMPFTTVRTGTFATAVNDATRDIRGLDVLDFDYSIIQVKHDITETANSTDLAMFVDPGVTINMTNDTKLQNDWYLKLDGKIDLVGKSQLVQTTLSDLDVTSAGSLERDQQGQSNKYNYNYWSSPVSSINNTTINHGFTVAGVMKDGTNVASPQSLQWTSGVNGSPTSPITLSSYWIFKFQNSSNTYANWASVGQNGTLLAGQGFTLKGCGSATADQNYTFVGKPNSGTITSTVGAGNLNLCGNPYPSAIDADKFIDDNASSIKGTLYIWQHYSSNTSHTTVQYQGGYATYTKTGGTAPVAPAGVSGLGSSSKTPKRFLPVGQGFFVTGSATGGTITFNNAQRLFIKEDDTTNSYSMFRSANSTVVANSNPTMNNAEDSFVEEPFMKLRLGFNSTDTYHRQTLLGFMNEHATAGFDNGYDGVSIETLTNDMYFINGTDKLNIDGDGYFNANNIYPIGVKNATSGNVSFVVDAKEHFADNQEIYIYDNVTSTYNSIKSQPYQVNLPAGTYDTRFSLRFTNGTLGTTDHQENHGISVIHSQANNMINIKNELQEVTVKSVSLFNLLGQKVTDWKIDSQNQADIQLQVSDLSTGTYIVKVFTDGGDITKKILVKK